MQLLIITYTGHRAAASQLQQHQEFFPPWQLLWEDPELSREQVAPHLP